MAIIFFFFVLAVFFFLVLAVFIFTFIFAFVFIHNFASFFIKFLSSSLGSFSDDTRNSPSTNSHNQSNSFATGDFRLGQKSSHSTVSVVFASDRDFVDSIRLSSKLSLMTSYILTLYYDGITWDSICFFKLEKVSYNEVITVNFERLLAASEDWDLLLVR